MKPSPRTPDHPAYRRRWAAGTAATVIAALLGAAVLLQTLPAVAAEPAAAAPQAVPVSVATVVQRDVNLWESFSGRLEAVDRVDVRARVAAAVQAVHFREGALVKKGDLLVTLDPAPFEAAVARAQADVSAAKVRQSHAQRERERATRLWRDSAIAQREYDERVNAEAESSAQLQGLEAALRSARLDLSYTRVRAPVSGRVGRLEVTVGNLVAAGPSAPVLTTMVSVSPIYASFEADEGTVARALRTLRASGGRQGGVDALERIPVRMGTNGDDGLPHEGKLQLVDNQVDPRSGTVRVRAVFDNAQGLLMPGQYARVEMGAARNEQVILINERAVGTDQDKRYVWVVGADDAVSYRAVRLGASVDGLRVVTEGLKPDERIVVNGLQRVRPGVKVAPRPVAMDAKPEVQARREGSPAS